MTKSKVQLTSKQMWRNLAMLAATVCVLVPLTYSQASRYNEEFRPQVHFSPNQHWTNDPNGLVYFHGEYHLFFQYNPFGDQWGHMSWGHAVSTDLAHWHELPVALPEQGNTMIFTGSIVVDHGNTSGLCHPDTECLVAIYTGSTHLTQGTRQTQNLAFSRDNGRTWMRYQGNPVLDLRMADFRDPSVTWNVSKKEWTMAVALPKEHVVRFYSSPNLKDWRKLSDFGPAGSVSGDWECPDLLQVRSTDGQRSMWALKVGLNPGAPQGGSGEQYFLGSFDGKSFTPSTEPSSHGWTNYGKDDYCAISFNGLPPGESTILIGWMNNWQYAEKLPTSPWRGQMSLPRRVTLFQDGAGLSLKQEPIIAALEDSPRSFALSSDADSRSAEIALGNAPYELDLHFEHTSENVIGVRIYSDPQHWTEIGFDTQTRQFYMDRTKGGAAVAAGFATRTVAPLISGRQYDLKLIVDRSSIEAYAQEGTIAMTNLIYPGSQQSKLIVFTQEGNPVVVRGTLRKLRSIWR